MIEDAIALVLLALALLAFVAAGVCAIREVGR